ncbi:MAG: S8 family serine peptidase [Promethearchaeota archaeon]
MKRFQRELGSIVLLTLLVSNILAVSSIAFGISLNQGNNLLLVNSKLDSVLKDALSSKDANTPTRVIITLTDGSDFDLASETIKARIGDSYKELHEYSIISAVSGELPLGRIPDIVELPFVQKIYHDRIYWIPKPSEMLEAAQIQQLYSTGLDAIGAPYVHSQGYLGDGIRIAILDTGINNTHPDLDGGKVVLARSFATDETEQTDLNGHGTHVAGTAAGTGEASSLAHKGVAPNALLIDAKCINGAGFGYSSDIIAAIQWSVLPTGVGGASADILSLSLGGGWADPYDPLSVAVDNAVAQGVVVVVAAGNGGPWYQSGSSPGAARGVITVGATDLDDQISSFSSKGPTLDNRVDPDVVAPGEDIIAPLSPDSIMDIAATYYGFEGGPIPGSGGDYLSLGGTSMATPHVAGAVALLMQAFPNLVNNPHAFRAALMNTADELSGYDPNVQGAGRINVSSALSYLDVRNSTAAGGKIPITTILPDEIPIEPWIVKFPGDMLSINVSFITGKPVNLDVTNIGTGSASPFITVGNSTYQTNGTWLLFVNDLAEIGVNITLPFDATPGIYSGRIEILNATDGVSLHNISVSFTIELPRGRVYFERLHNYDFEDSPYYNYLTFMQEMGDYGYDIDVNEKLITYETLMNYDILMLPDIELSFTESEVNAIQQFVSEGGSLLVLGSYYPFVAGEALNRLLTPYGIQYKTSYSESILSVEDLGITRLTSVDITITDIDSHPITTGVSSYTLGSGSPLISSPAQTIARYQNDPVLAYYQHPSGGRVAVFANELVFYYNLIDDLDNLQLAKNTLDWLLVEQSVHVSVAASLNYNASPSQLQFGIYVSQASRAGVTGLLNSTTINCTVVNSTVNYVNITEIGGGVYSGNFTASATGVYTVNVNVSVSSVLYTGTTSFRIVSSIPQIVGIDQRKGGSKPGDVEYPTWVELLELDFYGIDVICRFGEYLEVNGTVNSADNASIYFTSYPQNYYEHTLRNITYISANMSIISSKWNYTMTPTDPGFSAGTYVYIVEARNQTEGVNPDAFAVGSIVVVSVEPELDDNTSKVGGVAIPDMEIYEPLSVPMVQVGLGTSLSVEAVGTDREDSIADLKAFAWVIDISVYYLTGSPFIYQQLTLDGSSFTGSLSVPSSGVVSTPSGSYNLQSNWGYVLLLIIIDSEGDFDTSEEILFVVGGGGFDSFYMIIMAVMFMVMMSAMLLFQRRAARRRATAAPYGPEMAQYRPPDAPSIPRYCPYCGSPITPGSSFCMDCGSSLPTEEMPDETGAEPEEI